MHASNLAASGFLAVSLLVTACGAPPSSTAGNTAQTLNNTRIKPSVQVASTVGLSPPLASLSSSIPLDPDEDEAGVELELVNPPEDIPFEGSGGDPVVQRTGGNSGMPPPIINVPGVGILTGPLPPDTNGAVGPNHYFQYVNGFISVYDKQGTRLATPVSPRTLFTDLGGRCVASNGTDGVVLYDHLADRWVLARLVPATGDFRICIAISRTPDPLDTYYLYDFLYSATKLPDYPKFGVWPDGYYMSANLFQGSSNGGGGAAVFERTKMLDGLPAQMVQFDLFSVNPSYRGFLPSDLDGHPPPAGAPNYFGSAFHGTPDRLFLWQFHVDWDIPDNSTFGLNGLPNNMIVVANFSRVSCAGRQCIDQPAPGPKLDNVSQILHRIQYRNFGDHDSIVSTHVVDAGGNRAGIRWYELRDPGGVPYIFQQGTFAPDDGLHRWMGSVAMDGSGNIAAGYSASSATEFPSIRYAGRLTNDPLGEFSRGEATLITGGGVQTSPTSRWGDYSSMVVDPVDQCTFWYTQEYYAETSDHQWRTQIGSFRFLTCGTK